VAVTGASGFIGRHVVEHFEARGTEVVHLRRPFEPPALLNAMRAADAVVHLAGVVSALHEREYVAANVDGTRIVAEACGTAGVPLVHISSLAAAGPASPRAPRTEEDPAAPINAYGRSKLAGERTIAGIDDLRWTMIRPGVVYGPRDRALLPVFKVAARGFMPLVGRLDAAYSFIHVRDLVRIIAAAADRSPAGDTIFAAHVHPVTTREVLEGVRAASGSRAAIIRIPMIATRAAAVVGDLAGMVLGRPSVINGRRYAELASEGGVCRVDRLRDRLGIVAEIDLPEGLADAYAWYRREGWL
jgi:nucleoside-diphosphate-sugar epimerase